jgi:hypothetical protein
MTVLYKIIVNKQLIAKQCIMSNKHFKMRLIQQIKI